MSHGWFQIGDPVSTLSGGVDALFWFLTVLCGFTSLLIIGVMIAFAVRYRQRPGVLPPPGHLKSKKFVIETVWIGVPLITFLFIFVWGAKLYFRQLQTPAHALQMFGTAKQWMWKFQHPEGPREINELHVPIGVPVQITLISQDVIHSFYVPAFRFKRDVLPNRYTTVWFNVRKPGVYQLLCAEYCGTWHSLMRGKVIAMAQPDYENWIGQRTKESMASRGQVLFERLNCIQCHAPNSLIAAPRLNGLWGRKVPLTGGRTVNADDSYIRESILYPSRKITAGYQNVMPTYAGQLTEDELLDLIAFVKSLNAPDSASSGGAQKNGP